MYRYEIDVFVFSEVRYQIACGVRRNGVLIDVRSLASLDIAAFSALIQSRAEFSLLTTLGFSLVTSESSDVTVRLAETNRICFKNDLSDNDVTLLLSTIGSALTQSDPGNSDTCHITCLVKPNF